MLLRNKVKELDKNVEKGFYNVSLDVDSINEELRWLVNKLAELKKDNKALRSALEGLRGHVDDKFDELNRNGVATAINKLNNEVFKKHKKRGWSPTDVLYSMYDIGVAKQEPTLAGKVDAIIEHLGLDLSVKPAEKKEAKVVAKKVTKKKGKK